MALLTEFKEFAAKGNVVDLAVGVIVGAAFGKIVTSFVEDILMPPIGLLIEGIDFKKIQWVLKGPRIEEGKVVKEAVTMNVGEFINTSIDFIIIAFVIFMMVRTINRVKRKQEVKEMATVSSTDALLAEIRDELKKKNG